MKRSCFLAGLLLLSAQLCARGGVAYGTINNFDAVNDTGVECHGFEIELEDIHSADITYTYNWNHYGTPGITEDNSSPVRAKVRVRYESKKNPDGTWAAYTAIPSGPIAPTDGHRFTDPSINFGGEHFGLGYRGYPTNITYHWLIDDGAGNLARGPAVNVATPTFTYVPPNAGAPAQVQAAIRAPVAAPVKDFGPATWVKEIRTSSHNNRDVALRNLVDDNEDDPDDDNWRNGEPDEVEVEWQILQTEFRKDDGGKNAELVAAPEDLNNGDEIITRRWEFFEYVGPLDPESGEVMTEKVGPDGIHGVNEFAETVVVGKFIGSQMSAFDHELPIGFAEHLPDGEANQEYPARTVVIAAVDFTAELQGDLPAGMTFDAHTGQLSGTPSEAGIFSFKLVVTAPDYPEQTKTYILPVAAEGEALPPHSVVELSASPIGAGATSGGGFQTNDTTAVVVAEPAQGYGFSHWMENGKVVSRSPAYSFTNMVNRALSAMFVPMPRLSFAHAQGQLTLTWPTNVAGVTLEEKSSVAPGNWATVLTEKSVVDQNYQVQLPILNGERFFRLTRP